MFRFVVPISIAALFAVILMIFAAKSEELTVQQWQEDLEYLSQQVAYRHPNPWHYGVSSEEYFAAVEDLTLNIENGLPDGRIVLELFKILALIEDSHSSPVWESINVDVLPFRLIPVAFYSGSEGIFVHTAKDDYSEHLGTYLTHINGRPIENILRLLCSYVSGDNDLRRRIVSLWYIRNIAILYNLDITDSPDSAVYSLEQPNGDIKAVTFSVESNENYQRYIRLRDRSENPVPLWLKYRSKKYWYEYLTREKLIYMQFNSVQNDPDDPFDNFCEDLFNFIENHEVEKFAIDLRHNDGGNNAVYWPLIHRIALCKKINQPGHFFVIIGPGTESAAVSLAARFQELTQALFVGAPTGGRPNGHGVVSIIQLPNSKLQFKCSSLFVRPTLNPDRRPWITPQISAEITLEDYMNNRDPSLEAIIDYKPPITFTDFIESRNKPKSADALIALYHEFQAIPQNKWIDMESELNLYGWSFMKSGNTNDATKIFNFAIRQYPYSWKSYDNLAKVLESQDLYDQSLEYYEKSYKLNRMNFDALERLGKIR